MYRLAASIVGPEDGRDVTQDAFVRAWSELPRLRDPERFEPWLRRIVVNRCRDVGRRRGARVHEIQPLPFEPLSLDPRPWVERDVDLAAALARLSVEHRTVLALHYGADLTHEAVADAIGIPVGTVKSRLASALARLRTALEGPGSGVPRPGRIAP